jgi:ribonuclease HII
MRVTKTQRLNTGGPTELFELEARRCGYRSIAGLDEAGRGPLAGPVVAAAVILPRGCLLSGLDDSKQLDEATRLLLYDQILRRAMAFATGAASEEEIDRLNILEATRLAMERALALLSPSADFLLLDALNLPNIRLPQRPVIKGDGLCVSIAAASVIAKVTRDRIMVEHHRQYPQYNFASHKGYSTPEHLHYLRVHGPCAIHRRTFAPVHDLTPDTSDGVQIDVFFAT